VTRVPDTVVCGAGAAAGGHQWLRLGRTPHGHQRRGGVADDHQQIRNADGGSSSTTRSLTVFIILQDTASTMG
jgi:hypothetical protein